MKKSIFSKIGDKIRKKPNGKSNTTNQIQGDQTVNSRDDGIKIDKNTVESKQEERDQVLSEEAISKTEKEDTQIKGSAPDKDMAMEEEKTDLMPGKEADVSAYEEKSSEASETLKEDERLIASEAQDNERKANSIDLKERENIEKNEDKKADDQSHGGDREYGDASNEPLDLGAFDHDPHADSIDENIGDQATRDKTASIDSNADTEQIRDKQSDTISDTNRETEVEADDIDDKSEKSMIIPEGSSKREIEPISDDFFDTAEKAEETAKSETNIGTETSEDIEPDQFRAETKADDSAFEDNETDHAQKDTAKLSADLISDDEVLSDDEQSESVDFENEVISADVSLEDDADEFEGKDITEASDDKKKTEESIESEDAPTDVIKIESEVSAEITDGFFDTAEEAEETAKAENNIETETSEDIESDQFRAETKADDSAYEDNETDHAQKDTAKVSADLISGDEVLSDDEQSDSVDSENEVTSEDVSLEDDADKEEDREYQSEQRDDDLTTESDVSENDHEEDILSEIASSRQADSTSREDILKEDISEPTEELPVITGAMLNAQGMFTDLEDNDKEQKASASKEEMKDLSEAESESSSETEPEDTKKEGLSEDSSEQTDHAEDVADFFVIPDTSDKKDLASEHADQAEQKTDVLPVSEFTDVADHQDQRAHAGKVIDLSDSDEADEKAEKKDKADNSKDKTSQKPKKTKKGRIVFGILAAIVGVLAIAYVGGFIFYQNHFFFGTQISGVDASNKTVAEVEKSIKKDAKDYKLTLKEREDQSETITANDINLRYSDNNPVQAAMNKQNPFKWPLAVFGINDDELPTIYKYDEAKLNNKIQSLNAVSSMVNAENAHPVYSDGQIIIKGMIQGNEIDPKALTSAVKKAIAKGDETLDLEANKIYKNPAYGEDAQEVEAAKKVMEGYLQSEITYTIGEAKEVLGKDDFGPWLMTDESMNVYIDQEQAANWIHENLGAKYDTAWGEHEFKNSSGQQMTVSGGNYGWEIDEAAELSQLMTLIPSGQKNTHEPAWAQTAVTGKGTRADIGNTYIEISLGSQHMWCYKDGKLVIDTDVVTGDVNRGRGTPAGVYYIYGMQENATLVGEDYRTPVAYWMPFNGGVGIHDSTWRGASEYGGSTYMGNGSHGCVNTPLDVVSVIFQNANVGEPVVVY